MQAELPNDGRDPGYPRRQTGFQVLTPVNGNGDDFDFARFAEDVVTSADASKSPPVLLKQPAHFLAGNRLHTASSATWISGCGWRPSSRMTSR